MYLMYVDESGDPGVLNSPSRYFILSGLVVHEVDWQETLDDLIEFRREIKERFGLPLREEIHAAAMISRPGYLADRIARHDRLTILRNFADRLSLLDNLRIINIVVDKQGKPDDYDVFEMAWKVLLQRFENTILRRNFPGSLHAEERGMLFCDNTDGEKLRAVLRKMRQHNPIPNQQQFGQGYRNVLVTRVIEDPNPRDSRDSYFIQAVDLASYLLLQQIAPNAYMRKKSGNNYFSRLDPILCKIASQTDPQGVVYI